MCWRILCSWSLIFPSVSLSASRFWPRRWRTRLKKHSRFVATSTLWNPHLHHQDWCKTERKGSRIRQDLTANVKRHQSTEGRSEGLKLCFVIKRLLKDVKVKVIQTTRGRVLSQDIISPRGWGAETSPSLYKILDLEPNPILEKGGVFGFYFWPEFHLSRFKPACPDMLIGAARLGLTQPERNTCRHSTGLKKHHQPPLYAFKVEEMYLYCKVQSIFV